MRSTGERNLEFAALSPLLNHEAGQYLLEVLRPSRPAYLLPQILGVGWQDAAEGGRRDGQGRAAGGPGWHCTFTVSAHRSMESNKIAERHLTGTSRLQFLQSVRKPNVYNSISEM